MAYILTYDLILTKCYKIQNAVGVSKNNNKKNND